jgi:colanic acid biosynthesis glycosyl transferase WcaI
MSTVPSKPKTVLVVSQVFIPDPASVGQHVADVAIELARRGFDSGKYQIRVYASARGFENSANIYPRREMIGHVDIRRFPFASFGKKSMLLRVLGTAVFMIQAFFAVLFTRRLAGIFFSTSPPLIGLPMTIAAIIRRVPTVYWAMDLNPDQLLALGKIKPTGFVHGLLETVNRFILKNCTALIALDRFMADRLAARNIPRSKMLVLPPWPHEDKIHADSESTAENPFRARHALAGKFVIMYSGNHSPSNPLTTILDAVVQLKDDPDIRFLFVGGGSGKKEVEEYLHKYNLTKALSLPYQPMAELQHSLSAADVHIVSLGSNMVGIIHPCKIYGAMSVARPILFFGPKPSHISDLLEKHNIGIHVPHGDVPAALAAIRKFRQMTPADLQAMGKTAQTVLERSLSQSLLCGQFCDFVENAMGIIKSE